MAWLKAAIFGAVVALVAYGIIQGVYMIDPPTDAFLPSLPTISLAAFLAGWSHRREYEGHGLLQQAVPGIIAAFIVSTILLIVVAGSGTYGLIFGYGWSQIEIGMMLALSVISLTFFSIAAGGVFSVAGYRLKDTGAGGLKNGVFAMLVVFIIAYALETAFWGIAGVDIEIINVLVGLIKSLWKDLISIVLLGLVFTSLRRTFSDLLKRDSFLNLHLHAFIVALCLAVLIHLAILVGGEVMSGLGLLILAVPIVMGLYLTFVAKVSLRGVFKESKTVSYCAALLTLFGLAFSMNFLPALVLLGVDEFYTLLMLIYSTPFLIAIVLFPIILDFFDNEGVKEAVREGVYDAVGV